LKIIKGTIALALALAVVVILGGCGEAKNMTNNVFTDDNDETITAGSTRVLINYETVQAWVPLELLDGANPSTSIGSVLWADTDDAEEALDLFPAAVVVLGKLENITMKKVERQIAFLEYLARTFAVERFHLYGKGWGGTIALAIAHLRPDLTVSVGIVSPRLINGSGYYSPIDWVEDVFPDIPILVVLGLGLELDEYERYERKAVYVGLDTQFERVEVPDLRALREELSWVSRE